jgi:imidazoleglycerol-phosphate dehydratase/histidinol-phosphatase
MRRSEIERKTRETRVKVVWDLDRPATPKAGTGSGFLDHMLEQLGLHSGTGLEVECAGDTHIDMHHSVEDTAIAMGKALREAVGDKAGIERYGFYQVAMDEALARCALDLSGRFHLEYRANFSKDRVGDLEIELVEHFFRSLAENAGMTLHLDLERGTNAHHGVESMFKAFARALAMAIGPARNGDKGIPSTKGAL